MKRFVYFSLIFAICLFVCGCGGDNSSTYYFNIKESSFICRVGDNFNVFEQEISSNLNSYEHMHIYSNNTSVANVLKDKTIQILSEGEATIIVSGRVKGQSLSDSFKIIANNSVIGSEPEVSEDEDLDNAIFTANKMLDNIVSDERTVIYKILKNGASFTNFKIENLENENIVDILKLNDRVEVVFKADYNFSLNILSDKNNVILVLNF